MDKGVAVQVGATVGEGEAVGLSVGVFVVSGNGDGVQEDGSAPWAGIIVACISSVGKMLVGGGKTPEARTQDDSPTSKVNKSHPHRFINSPSRREAEQEECM